MSDERASWAIYAVLYLAAWENLVTYFRVWDVENTKNEEENIAVTTILKSHVIISGQTQSTATVLLNLVQCLVVTCSVLTRAVGLDCEKFTSRHTL